MTPDVSVIIVSWNVWDMVRDCIESVQNQTSTSYEIIVVDNASHDHSAENIAKTFPAVKLIANTDNRGFAAANNQGLDVATGRYVLLLNPDTLVLDGAIDTMLGWMDQHPDVGCGGCQVYESEHDIQNTCFSDTSPLSVFLVMSGLHRLFSNSRFWGNPEYSWWDRKTEMDVDVVSGMFMLVPQRVVSDVGGMDDAFFVYSEEADWCRRIRNAGYRCVFTPVARILHRDGGGKSTFQIQPKMYVQLQKSQMIYIRKHYGLLGYAVVKSMYLGIMTARLTVFGALSLIKRGPRFSNLTHLAWIAIKFHFLGMEPSK